MNDFMYLLCDVNERQCIRNVAGVFHSVDDAKAMTDNPEIIKQLHITTLGDWHVIDTGVGETWQRPFTTETEYSSTARRWRIFEFYIGTPYGTPPKQVKA